MGPPPIGGRAEADFLDLDFEAIFKLFLRDFKESLKSGRKLYSSIKHEVFAKEFNQNIEFHR